MTSSSGPLAPDRSLAQATASAATFAVGVPASNAAATFLPPMVPWSRNQNISFSASWRFRRGRQIVLAVNRSMISNALGKYKVPSMSMLTNSPLAVAIDNACVEIPHACASRGPGTTSPSLIHSARADAPRTSAAAKPPRGGVGFLFPPGIIARKPQPGKLHQAKNMLTFIVEAEHWKGQAVQLMGDRRRARARPR